MNITSDFLSSFIGLNAFGNTSAGTGGTGLSTLSESSSSRLSWRDQRSTDITILTSDGDRVTLSSSTERKASYEVYNASGSINGTSANARMETFSLSSGRSISITVEGELSEQERADIALVASTVDKMANEFFDGDVDEALASILEGGGTGTISSFSASTTRSRSFSFTHQSVVELGALVGTAAAQGALGADGTNSPAAQGVASQGTAPQGTTSQGTAPQGAAGTPAAVQEPGVITLDSTLSFINELSGTVKGLALDLGEIQEELFELMDELFEEIAEEQDPNKAMEKLVHFVKEEFLHELREIIEDASEHGDDHDDDDDDHDDVDEIEGHRNEIDEDHDDHHTAPATQPAATQTAAAVTQPAATQPPAPQPAVSQVDAGPVTTEPQPTAGTPV